MMSPEGSAPLLGRPIPRPPIAWNVVVVVATLVFLVGGCGLLSLHSPSPRAVALSLASEGSPGTYPPPLRTARPPGLCVDASAACTEWLPIGKQKKVLLYRSHQLWVRHPQITVAWIQVHGDLRNPEHYFATCLAAAFLGRALDTTLVIAPRFAASRGHVDDDVCADRLSPGEADWDCTRWKHGDHERNDFSLTTFGVADLLIRHLSDRKFYPNLKRIIVAGHSAGGQFAARYQIANRVQNSLEAALAVFVSNPSTYTWPDNYRPRLVGDADPQAARDAWATELPHTNFTYRPFPANACSTFNSWPMGLTDLYGYAADTPPKRLLENLVNWPVTLLAGAEDVVPAHGFESDCAAAAMGPTRRSRAEAYARYLQTHYHAKLDVVIVPACGHNDRCVYTHGVVLPLLFPDTAPPSTYKPRSYGIPASN